VWLLDFNVWNLPWLWLWRWLLTLRKNLTLVLLQLIKLA